MTTGILVLHIILAVAMIGIILLQRNEGGALGMGGSNSMGGLMSTRGTANLLTHVTAVLATSFFVTTIVLALMFKGSHKPKSILDEETKPAVEQQVPVAAPVAQETASSVADSQPAPEAAPSSPKVAPEAPSPVPQPKK
jgi:preprotein translocase subunit SecG